MESVPSCFFASVNGKARGGTGRSVEMRRLSVDDDAIKCGFCWLLLFAFFLFFSLIVGKREANRPLLQLSK